MKIHALKPFVIRDASTGALTSVACGQIATVNDTLGADLIADGFADEYTLITPEGNVNITGTGEVDVTTYATAQVVDENLAAENIKKDVTILGVTGTYEA